MLVCDVQELVSLRVKNKGLPLSQQEILVPFRGSFRNLPRASPSFFSGVPRPSLSVSIWYMWHVFNSLHLVTAFALTFKRMLSFE